MNNFARLCKVFSLSLLCFLLIALSSSSTVAQAPTGVFLTEVFYDHSSSDDGYEWVELYNTSLVTVDLSGYCLGNGGTDYTYSLVQLSGSIAPNTPFVVGGPSADTENGNPIYNQAVDFDPDFQNVTSGVADGVALFNVVCTSVTSVTVPIDAVVYGTNNTNNLIDETGSANPPEVEDAPAGSSIIRDTRQPTSGWTIGSPDPNQADNANAVTFAGVATLASFPTPWVGLTIASLLGGSLLVITRRRQR